MGVRVIVSRTIPAKEVPDVWVDDSTGTTQIFTSRADCVHSDNDDSVARVTRFALAAIPFDGKTVAWIGGGLCIGPRLFAIADCKQTVYEIEPALYEFCPDRVLFIPGDWKDTIKGKYDLIIYDLGGEVPRETLAKYLNPGGKILPEKD